jgi:hypothetical protein
VLQNILKKTIPQAILNDIVPDLDRFGQRVVEGTFFITFSFLFFYFLFITNFCLFSDIAVMGDNVETPSNYPQLRQYDAWCR